MNKNQNRLIATARQYALVTFLGLGVSFAVAKTTINTQKVERMAEPGWMLDNPTNPISPASYSLITAGTIDDQCPGEAEVCGIKAPNNGSDYPVIDEYLEQEILDGEKNERVFLKD